MTWGAWIGLLVMIVSETATLAHVEPFWSWNTPICWTGFILFADAIVFRAHGNSWIRSAPREFVCLALASIPLWMAFEFYNRFIDNWYYVGLPENAALRYFGYAWSFATIWPAIFEGAELVAVWRGARRAPPPLASALRRSSISAAGADSLSSRGPQALPPALVAVSIAAGVSMLVWPLLWPSRYLAAPVWLGFILVLDPINARLGAESLLADARRRQFDRFVNLALSGLLCGLLWEFWNYWSRAKWHYTVPIMEHVKLFEMPLPGFLGFPAFALECFTMYVFVRMAFTKLGRTIAL